MLLSRRPFPAAFFSRYQMRRKFPHSFLLLEHLLLDVEQQRRKHEKIDSMSSTHFGKNELCCAIYEPLLQSPKRAPRTSCASLATPSCQFPHQAPYASFNCRESFIYAHSSVFPYASPASRTQQCSFEDYFEIWELPFCDIPCLWKNHLCKFTGDKMNKWVWCLLSSARFPIPNAKFLSLLKASGIFIANLCSQTILDECVLCGNANSTRQYLDSLQWSTERCLRENI